MFCPFFTVYPSPAESETLPNPLHYVVLPVQKHLFLSPKDRTILGGERKNLGRKPH